jgi:FMN phosphatase YigB (HAD superfamily)
MENKNPIVIFDLDDCLLHYNKHFVEWIFTNKYTQIDTHDTSTWYKPEFIFEFNHSERFIQRDRLPLYYTFRRLHSELKHPCILSACGEGLEGEVQDALGMEYFNTFFIKCVNSSYDKYKALDELKETWNVLVIDDKKETIEWCKKHGIKAILANQDIDLVNSMVYNHMYGKLSQ